MGLRLLGLKGAISREIRGLVALVPRCPWGLVRGSFKIIIIIIALVIAVNSY